VKVALWSPRVGSGWLAALGPHLERRMRIEWVTEKAAAAPDVDVDVYHLDDDPDHAFVYQALVRRPGLVVLEEWGLHRLVHAATAGQGDPRSYLREARRAHGDRGAFVAGEVLRGEEGEWLCALLDLNQSVLEASRALIATSEAIRLRAERRLRTRPVRHLPLAFQSTPTRSGEVRERAERLPDVPRVLFVRPAGDAALETRLEGVAREMSRPDQPALALWSDARDPALDEKLRVADVVVALRPPGRLGVPEAVARALAAGCPTLVTAGTGEAQDVPPGVVGVVCPGAAERAMLVALLRRLLGDPSLRRAMGAGARRLAEGLRSADACASIFGELALGIAAQRRPGAIGVPGRGSLARSALDEVDWGARELGLASLPPGVESAVASLFGEIR
jgi:glycosyltransferase involved in cell wall biosynthesis